MCSMLMSVALEILDTEVLGAFAKMMMCFFVLVWGLFAFCSFFFTTYCELCFFMKIVL